MDILYSEATGALLGTRDSIIFYHGLMSGWSKEIPDHVDLEFTQSQESGGVGGAATVHTLTPGALPILTDTVDIGSVAWGAAGLVERWTFVAARTGPYEVAIAGTIALAIDGLVAAINADTIQNIVADAVGGVDLRIQSANIPAGTVEVGVRNLAGSASVINGGGVAWVPTAAGAGNVAGAPSWSVIARTNEFVKIRVRGLEPTDSLNYRVRCWRMHSLIRSAISAPITFGSDGTVTAGGYTFTTQALTNFHSLGVRTGHLLMIVEPDATVFNTRNNGVYQITHMSVNGQILTLDKQFKVAATNDLNYSVGQGLVARGTEYGAAGASIVQVPFDLPATSAHTQANPATDAELPAEAVVTAEIADGALSALPAGRAKVAAGFFGSGVAASNAHFEDGFWQTGNLAKFTDGQFTPAKLSIEPCGDIGRLACGYIRFIAATNVADTVTIGAAEVWTAVAGAPGANEYDQGGGTVTTCATSLADRINLDAASQVRAVLAGPLATENVVLLFPKTIAAGDLALAENSPGGPRTAVSAAFMVGSTAAADRSLAYGFYTVTAADVTTMAPGGANGEIVIAGIPSTAAPTLLSAEVRDINGVHKSKASVGVRLAQSGGNEYALCVQEGGGAAVLAAADVITFLVGVTA